MYGTCWSACIQGIEGALIRVEIDISSGLPLFSIVGLPDSAVRESTERVRAALRNGSFEFPMRRITVNLAPADIRKEGASFDLAIAVGILLTSGQWPAALAEDTLFLGELSLLGELRPVPGVLSMVHAAKTAGLKRVVVPWDNAQEASLIEGIRVLPAKRLSDIQEECPRSAFHMDGDFRNRSSDDEKSADAYDFADVIGQQQAKRALTVAVAGTHNLVFIGPPGSGKTMLMRRLPSILPPLSDEEALEVTKIFSATGQTRTRGSLMRQRPFRAPHHTISPQGLIGGGSFPKPGEISLAHRGVLFLDEWPEFSRSVLESLRQPMEDASVTIARAKMSHTFPARFALAATMNPCPCGYDGYEDEHRSCTCTPLRKRAYLSRLSGPLLDRIDLSMDVSKLNADEAALLQAEAGGHKGEHLSSKEMAEGIARALGAQADRYKGTGLRYNSELSGKQLHHYCPLDSASAELLLTAYKTMGLSARAHTKVLKVARTIADIEGVDRIQAGHVNEALFYRSLDLRYKRSTDADAPRPPR